MKNVALVGAVDRNNYGDLLFPIVFKRWMELNGYDFNYTNIGSISSDLSNIEALPSKDFSTLYTNRYDAIVLVGGAILASPWIHTHQHILTTKSETTFYKLLYKTTPTTFSNIIARKKLNGQTFMPWILPKNIFAGKPKIIYNTVSGTGLTQYSAKSKKQIQSDLNDSDYISVRDPLSERSLMEMGVKNISTAPDSAIIMSKFFPIEWLNQKLTSENRRVLNSTKKSYICFQIAEKYAKNNIETYSEILENISRKYQLPVILLPIGRANLHLDHLPLQKIYGKLKNKIDIQIINSNTIYETMGIIANSNLFLGTSLHGNITAISYGVRCVGLDERVTKLKYFLEEYSFGQFAGIPSEIINTVEKVLEIPINELERNRDNLIKLVDENFEKIAITIEQN